MKIFLASIAFMLFGTDLFNIARSYENNFIESVNDGTWNYIKTVEYGAPSGDDEEIWEDFTAEAVVDEPLGSAEDGYIRYYSCGDTLYQVYITDDSFNVATWEGDWVQSVESWSIIKDGE